MDHRLVNFYGKNTKLDCFKISPCGRKPNCYVFSTLDSLLFGLDENRLMNEPLDELLLKLHDYNNWILEEVPWLQKKEKKSQLFSACEWKSELVKLGWFVSHHFWSGLNCLYASIEAIFWSANYCFHTITPGSWWSTGRWRSPGTERRPGQWIQQHVCACVRVYEFFKF